MQQPTTITSAPEPDEVEKPDRWVRGVLDLILLTHQGKLAWKRVTDPALSEDEYQASLRQRTIKLQALPLAIRYGVINHGFFNPLSPGGMFGEREPMSRRYPYLRIYSGGELMASFPDIAPIKALAEAVSMQITKQEDSVLQEIHAYVEGVAP